MYFGQFYARVFALCCAALLGYALFLIFSPFALPTTWAAFLAFLLYPVSERLQRRLRFSNTLAAGVLTALSPIVIILPLSALSVEFIAQISLLLRQVQKSASQLDIQSFSDLQHFPAIARINGWLQEYAGISATQVQSWVVSSTSDVMQRAASYGGSFFIGALGSLFSLLVLVALLFFFLRDGARITERARHLIPLDDERTARLFARIADVTRAIVFGTTVTALLEGLLIGVGFAIAHLPLPLVFGVIAGLLSLLPVGGSAFVWVPAAAYLFIDKHWGYGIFLLVWGGAISALDNMVRPMLISGRARMSTLAVFIGVLGGIPAFGTIGVIAGPVILCLVIALIEFAEEGGRPTSLG